MTQPLLVVMGVSGVGKTTVGQLLARRLGVPFVEGDEYHPPENVAKMRGGTPLTDADRAGWLRALAERIREARDAGTGIVVTCSALKHAYRDVLRAAASELRFVHLRGPRGLIAERLEERSGHYMPPTLLDSQLATLEEPGSDEGAWVFDVDRPPEEIVDAIVATARTTA